MSYLTVFSRTTTTFDCRECKREWVKLDGDIIAPPEPCPFCTIEMLREALHQEGHTIILTDEGTMKPSELIDNFLKRLEEDGVDDVSIFTIRTKFLPRITQLEAENEALKKENLAVYKRVDALDDLLKRV